MRWLFYSLLCSVSGTQGGQFFAAPRWAQALLPEQLLTRLAGWCPLMAERLAFSCRGLSGGWLPWAAPPTVWWPCCRANHKTQEMEFTAWEALGPETDIESLQLYAIGEAVHESELKEKEPTPPSQWEKVKAFCSLLLTCNHMLSGHVEIRLPSSKALAHLTPLQNGSPEGSKPRVSFAKQVQVRAKVLGAGHLEIAP